MVHTRGYYTTRADGQNKNTKKSSSKNNIRFTNQARAVGSFILRICFKLLDNKSKWFNSEKDSLAGPLILQLDGPSADSSAV